MLIYIFAVLYGLVIGSFLNVCIYRIPAGLSIVKPRSRCNQCETTLQAIDLVPILSWISTRGRCRYCQTKVSSRYAVVEALTAILTLVVVVVSPMTLELVFRLLFTYVAIIIAFIDWDTQEIPEILNIFVLGLGLAHWVYISLVSGFSWSPLLGAISGFSLLLLLLIFGAMGGGDVKYMGAAGFLLGLWNTLLALYLGFVVGGIVAIVLVLLKRAKRKTMIAFGPYLVLGTWIVLLFEQPIIQMYTKLFIY